MIQARFLRCAFLFYCISIASASSAKVRQVLQQDGYAEDSFSVMIKTKSASEKVTSVSVTVKDPTIITQVDSGHNGKNVTVHLEMAGQVGQTELVIVARTDSVTASYEVSYVIDVLGLSFSADGGSKSAVLSGDNGAGVSFSSYLQSAGGMTLKGRAYIGDGKFIALTGSKVTVKELKSKADTKLLSPDGVTFSANSMKIVPNAYRVGSGEVVVEIEHPDIELDNELASTSVIVRMGNSPYPNPVVVGPANNKKVAKLDLSSSKKAAAVDMFNLIGRPDVGSLQAVRGMVSNKTVFLMDRSLSELGETDQRVQFIMADPNMTRGKYTIMVEAEYSQGQILSAIQEDDLIIDVTGSSSLLGKKARIIAISVGLGVVASFILCGLLIFYWRRSVTASRNLDSSYSQGSGAQPFGVPAPVASLDDGILRDSYARNESTFTNDESNGHVEIMSVPPAQALQRKNSDRPASEYSV